MGNCLGNLDMRGFLDSFLLWGGFIEGGDGHGGELTWNLGELC